MAKKAKVPSIQELYPGTRGNITNMTSSSGRGGSVTSNTSAPSIFDLHPEFRNTFQNIGQNANLYSTAVNYLNSGNVDPNMKPYIEHFVNTYGANLQNAYNLAQRYNLMNNPEVKKALQPYLNTRLGKATQGVLTGYEQGMSAIGQDLQQRSDALTNKFMAEQAQQLTDIKNVGEQQKKAITAQTQEKASLAEGLTSRRGFGTQAMAQNVMADIQNTELQQKTAIDSATLDKALAAQNLYNQLLQIQFKEYMNSKSLADLNKLTAILNTLNQINMFLEGTKK